MNRKIIDVLQTQIRRLSGKGRQTEKVIQPPAAHPQPNTTLNKTLPNNKAGLVSIRTVHPQNKINIITPPSNQANPDGNNSLTAGPIPSTQEDSQDASSRMSMDDAEAGCTESSPVVTPPGISPNTIHSGIPTNTGRHLRRCGTRAAGDRHCVKQGLSNHRVRRRRDKYQLRYTGEY